VAPVGFETRELMSAAQRLLLCEASSSPPLVQSACRSPHFRVVCVIIKEYSSRLVALSQQYLMRFDLLCRSASVPNAAATYDDDNLLYVSLLPQVRLPALSVSLTTISAPEPARLTYSKVNIKRASRTSAFSRAYRRRVRAGPKADVNTNVPGIREMTSEGNSFFGTKGTEENGQR
jgi:hypothetical protein